MKIENIKNFEILNIFFWKFKITKNTTFRYFFEQWKSQKFWNFLKIENQYFSHAFLDFFDLEFSFWELCFFPKFSLIFLNCFCFVLYFHLNYFSKFSSFWNRRKIKYITPKISKFYYFDHNIGSDFTFNEIFVRKFQKAPKIGEKVNQEEEKISELIKNRKNRKFEHFNAILSFFFAFFFQ